MYLLASAVTEHICIQKYRVCGTYLQYFEDQWPTHHAPYHVIVSRQYQSFSLNMLQGTLNHKSKSIQYVEELSNLCSMNEGSKLFLISKQHCNIWYPVTEKDKLIDWVHHLISGPYRYHQWKNTGQGATCLQHYTRRMNDYSLVKKVSEWIQGEFFIHHWCSTSKARRGEYCTSQSIQSCHVSKNTAHPIQIQLKHKQFWPPKKLNYTTKV